MKYIVLVPDGMADLPVEKLGGKTPLETADTPNMDFVAQSGMLLEVSTVPDGLQPASDVANLSIMGYDPKKYYSGRAPLEAAYLGIDLGQEDVAFRCNLVTISEGKMEDYSAGHISTREASNLIGDLGIKIGSEKVRFYPGVSYRHLLVLTGFDVKGLVQTKTVPPHDILGQEIRKFLPSGSQEKILRELMENSKSALAASEINKVRLDLKENPANMIWLWGQGQKPQIPRFADKFNLEGSVISAVDLIKGIGKIVGLDVIEVEGATGYYDTNYLGKAHAALKALESKDYVFVHVEAPDEAGHNGDLRMKIASIERFDKMVVGPILEHFRSRNDFRLLVLPDHATPVSLRRHTAGPVCAAMMGAGIKPDEFMHFNEILAKSSKVRYQGHELMDKFLKCDFPSPDDQAVR